MDEALLRELVDKQAIRDLIYTYCRSVDRLDVPLGQSIWHVDGHADYGADYYQGPGKGVIELICRSHLAMTSHSHQVSNILITLAGDMAGSESYVTGTMRLEREGKVLHMSVWGRYCDRWERREGRWGLLNRTVVMDHTELREVSPMKPQGAAPARDASDPSYAALEMSS